MRRLAAVSLLLLAMTPAGCVRRQIDITSTPSGALVKVNDREVGRTPCRIEFDHYGVFDVRLTHPGYESVVGVGRADAPFWDWAGIDLLGELAPMDLVSSNQWHFAMVPDREDRENLVIRARALQSDLRAIEQEQPVERVAPSAPSPAAASRQDGERGVVPTPPSVLEPGPSAAPPASSPDAR